MTQILLINSDLAANRGDRAIAEGNIELIKQQFPDAHIIGLSEFPKRDRKWYGIDFIQMNFQSLSLVDFVRLSRAVRKSDIVLWGGGEILKDYTNKAALWYWTFKIMLLSHLNPNIYGAFQGIGPTTSPRSRRLIVRVVNHCKVFTVRDKESAEKLIEWGVAPHKLRTASDPAILPVPQPIDDELLHKLEVSYNINKKSLNNFICIGPRDWFHYEPGGVVPFKYKKRLSRFFGLRLVRTKDPRHKRYIAQLGELIKEISTRNPNQNIFLIPMHMGESDCALCRTLSAYAINPEQVRVLDQDNLSPKELRSIIARAKAMIGFRLHSTIIGTSAGVPSINLYYVDKGRVYFDQINQTKLTQPIEFVLDDNFVETTLEMLDQLHANHSKIQRELNASIRSLRATITNVFSELFDTHSQEPETQPTEELKAPSLKKRIAKLIPAAFYILLIVFFVLYIRSINFATLRGAQFNWWYISISIILGLVFRYFGTYIWIVILRGLGAKGIKYSVSLVYIYAKSWLGRYIPGTAPWILGKIYFASQHGIDKNKLAVSSLLEGALQIVAQLVLSFALLIFDTRLNKVGADLKILMTVVLIGCIICLIPPVFNFLVAFAYKIIRHKALDREHYANTRTILSGAGLYLIAAVINGLSLYYIAKGVYGPLDYTQILFIMGVGTFAGAAGMIAIFVPSGIGVRDGIQLTLLSLIMPASFALVITVFTRIISIVTDIAFFAIAKLFDRGSASR